MFKKESKKDNFENCDLKFENNGEKNDIKIKNEVKEYSKMEEKGNGFQKFELSDLKEPKINALSVIQAQNNSSFISRS